MRFAAVLFDLDGVLVDSEPLHEEAARRVLDRYGLPVAPDAFERLRGQPDRALFSEVLNGADRDDLDVPGLIREKEAAYRDLTGRLEPIPGAIDLLDALRAQGVPRACVTSATRADQQEVFAALRLTPYFAAVVTADDVTAGKPAPDPYLKGAEELAVAPDRCVVIEDAPHGIRAARAAGCTAVGLPTSFEADVLRAAGAAFVAESHAVLRRWLFSGDGTPDEALR